jgi:hypothetical protein
MQISVLCRVANPGNVATFVWKMSGLELVRLGSICATCSMNLGPTLSSIKVKVNLSLCLTKHHAMKTYWGVEV